MSDGTIVKDNWNADLYDSKHTFVSQYGEDLVELLKPKKGEHILDLGCGTGDLANKLHNFKVNMIGVDNSKNMVQQAQLKYPHIKFRVEDAVKLDYKNEFDAVISNAALHWIKPPKQALQSIYNSLKQGGRFVAEFGGKGNVQTISDEIMTQFKSQGIQYNADQLPWYFPSIGEYSALMEEVGFRVTLAHHFDRPTSLEGNDGLKNWIKMFANSMFEGISEETKALIIKKVETNLNEVLFRDGVWIADYKRIRVIGIKE